MTSRTPAFSNGGAGLADGYNDRQWRQVQDGQPRGGTKDQAQSEREKRGPRHSDPGAESSSRRSGGCHLTRSAQGGGPAPASKIVTGIGTSRRRAKRRGLVVLCPDNNPHQPANHLTVE